MTKPFAVWTELRKCQRAVRSWSDCPCLHRANVYHNNANKTQLTNDQLRSSSPRLNYTSVRNISSTILYIHNSTWPILTVSMKATLYLNHRAQNYHGPQTTHVLQTNYLTFTRSHCLTRQADVYFMKDNFITNLTTCHHDDGPTLFYSSVTVLMATLTAQNHQPVCAGFQD